MKLAAIIAEYNPFHNGHAALCAAAREAGATHVMAVMSGNFVQRGEPAIAEKRIRAASALACGVDLVVELPLPWAMATAQVFARGGVDIMAASGCVDMLCFGSECGDAALLREAAQAVDHPLVEEKLREYLREGVTYAKARTLAVKDVMGEEIAMVLSSPNDLLGVEYLRQAAGLCWSPEVFVMKRQGVFHDGTNPSGKFASASHLRTQRDNMEYTAPYMPPAAAEILRAAKGDGLYPARKEKLETAILAKLRGLSRQELARLPDLSEGLENRFYAAIRAATTLEELHQALKTKRYTMARVRRLVLSAFLDIEKGTSASVPPYIRVLGIGKNGREVLAKIGESSAIPVGTSLAKLVRHRDKAISHTARLEAAATDLYTLALDVPRPCGYDLTAKIAISGQCQEKSVQNVIQ